jgi:hypothetical protein
MNTESISNLLNKLTVDVIKSDVCDLNILCLTYYNDKQVIKSDKIKLKNIIDFCFNVILLIDTDNLNSPYVLKAINIKALYLKLDLLFDVKEDPSGFADMITKLL